MKYYLLFLLFLTACTVSQPITDLQTVDWPVVKQRCSLYYPSHNYGLIEKELGMNPIDCQALMESEIEPCISNNDCQAYSIKIGGSYPICYRRGHFETKSNRLTEKVNRTFYQSGEIETYFCVCDSSYCVYKRPNQKVKVEKLSPGIYFSTHLEYVKDTLKIEGKKVTMDVKNIVEFQGEPTRGISIGRAMVDSCEIYVDDININDTFIVFKPKEIRTMTLDCDKLGSEVFMQIYYTLDSDVEFYNTKIIWGDRIKTKDGGSTFPKPHSLSGKIVFP
jgi:hypothetical protein